MESTETGHFMTGVLNPGDWNSAKWIAAPSSVTQSPLIAKRVQINDRTAVTHATLFISGLGFFKVFVNGVDLNARPKPPIALTPGWTNYEVRVPYSTYQVTDEVMQQSETLIEVILGMGWRNSTDFPLHDPAPPKPDSRARVLRAMLEVTYANGTEITFATDESWESRLSAYTYDSVYDGETYDARLANRTHDVTVNVVATNGPAGAMFLPPTPYIAEVGVEKAVSVYKLASDPSKQIADFGYNSAGVCRLTVDALKLGTSVQIRHAEVPMHPPYGAVDGSLYYDNLRGARQTDKFTSDGATRTYKPSLTYHGFRYAEITGYPRDLTAFDINKVVINSNLKANGHLNTSNPLLNKIQESVVRGQLSNLMSIPTDCDQRDERLGWMGDAGLSADSMALNMHMEAFQPYFLQLIRDEQINGSLPDVVPFYRYGRRPADPSWGAALPQIMWVLYKYYGDINTVKEFFPSLLQYMEFMLSKIPPGDGGIGKLYAYYGDWCPPPPQPAVDTSFPAAFSLLTNIKQARELAAALGYAENVTNFEKIFNEQAKSFNKAFLNDGKYLNGLQITYVLPLALGIVPADIMDDFVKAFLNQLTGTDKTHITAGIIGTKFILPVLSQLKQHSLAVEIVQQTSYPSWGYMIHNPYEPATTIWELWNAFNGSAGMDSRNHHMFSSVSGWMMTEMVGLSIPEGSYGFNEIHFHPARTLDLSRASVSLEHPKKVKMSWQRKGGIQCAKSPEDSSSVNPGLPKHDGLKLSCGEEGVISEVLFASFGTPTGSCGYYSTGSCHAESSVAVVKELCLGKENCYVPTDGDFWGNVCPGVTKWLSVAVQCMSTGQGAAVDYKFSSLHLDLSIPVGSKGAVFLPAHGKRDLKVWEGEDLIWYERDESLKGVPGVLSSEWLPESDSLKLQLSSGSYSFVVRGEAPERKCLDSRESEGGALALKCSSKSEVIGSIDWASYGNPQTPGDCFSHSVGECSAGSSPMAVEKECVGKQECSIPLNEKFFGELTSSHGCNEGPLYLIVEYTCK